MAETNNSRTHTQSALTVSTTMSSKESKGSRQLLPIKWYNVPFGRICKSQSRPSLRNGSTSKVRHKVNLTKAAEAGNRITDALQHVKNNNEVSGPEDIPLRC